MALRSLPALGIRGREGRAHGLTAPSRRLRLLLPGPRCCLAWNGEHTAGTWGVGLWGLLRKASLTELYNKFWEVYGALRPRLISAV